MNLRQRTLLHALFPLSLFIILPALLDWFFPFAFLIILKIACIAIIPTALLILLRRRSNYLVPVHPDWKKLKFWQWLLYMFLLTTIFYALFLGQLCTISQYMIQNQQMNFIQLLPWLKQTLNFILQNPLFFPWSFVALCILVLFPLNRLYSNSLFSHLIHSNKIKLKVWRRAFDIIISNAFLALICSSGAFSIIQLCTFLFPTFNVFLQPLPSMLLCGLIIFILSASKLQNFLKRLAAKQWSIATVLGSIIILTCILGSIAGYIFFHFLLNLLLKFNWHPFQLTDMHYYVFAAEIWSTAWWIVAAPFLASFIVRISAGRLMISIMAFLLLIPITLLHLFQDVSAAILNAIMTPAIAFGIQLFAIVCLLTIIAGTESHSLMRLGFYPAKELKKSRAANLHQLLLLTICLLAITSFLGIVWLQFYFGLIAFSIIGCLIFVLLNLRIKQP